MGFGGQDRGAALGIVTTGLLARMLSEQELGAYFLALSIVSLGAVVGSLGLPKTVVGLVAENVGVGRPGCARRMIRTVLGLGVFGALGIYGQLADAELPSQLEGYKCYSVRAVLSPPFPFNRAAPSSCFLASVPGPSGSGLCRTSPSRSSRKLSSGE